MTEYNTYRARVGDAIRVTLTTGETLDMTVHTVMEPGTYGTSHASGPRVLAWVAPGRYGITLGASNITRVESRD